MRVDLQQIINNPMTVKLALFLGKIVPPYLGVPLCNTIGDWVASRRASDMTRAIRCNQWVVRGANLEKEMLDQAVRETLRNNIYDLYRLYHGAQNPQETPDLIH